MKSCKSLFNATLFKSNITRFLPFSILFLIVELIIFPLIFFTGYDSLDNSIHYDDIIMTGVISDGFTFLFAGIFAILVFGYLFTANKSIALHSFPIGRRALFATNTISAYVLLIAPQLIGFTLSIPALIMHGKSSDEIKSAILLQFATTLLASFIVLTLAILSVMLSGNAFAAMIIYFIVNFLYSAVVYLLSYAVSVFGVGLDENVIVGEGSFGTILSPVVELFVRMIDYEAVGSRIDVSDYYRALIIYFVISIALCFIAFLLYKSRELEVAGEMAAFESELPFIRVIVSIIGGTVVSMFLGEIIDFGRAGYIALYIIFSFLIYFATQMVLKKKFNIFSFNLIIRWFVCCALSIGIALSLAAYQTNYIPDINDVKETNTFFSYNIYSKDKEKIKLINELHKELIDYSKNNNTRRNTLYEDVEDYVEYDQFLNISISYNLKNGRSVSRTYLYESDNKKINSLINEIENKNEYVGVFDCLDEIDFSINQIWINDYSTDNSVSVPADEFENFIKICREDTKALTDNYTSLKISEDNSSNLEVFIAGTIPKGTDIKMIESRSTGTDFIEGYFNYNNYSDEFKQGNNTELELYIVKFPKDSKILQYYKENKE